MYGTTSCGCHGFISKEKIFLSVTLLIEANDSCGMASLDTSCMDVGMTVLSHYKSMGVSYMPEFQSNQPKNHMDPFLFLT